MFGQMGQIMKLLGDLPRLQKEAKAVQERLAAERVIGEAGGGQVRVTLDGKGELQDVAFEPELIAGGDRELIEELTVAAFRDGLTKSRELMQREMSALTGGMDLGGLGGMLGG